MIFSIWYKLSSYFTSLIMIPLLSLIDRVSTCIIFCNDHSEIFVKLTSGQFHQNFLLPAFFFSSVRVILSGSSACLIIFLFKSGHFRYYIIATLDTGCLPLGFVIVIHLFIYLVIVWIISMRSILLCSLSVKSLIVLFKKHSLGYSQSYHKMIVVLAGLPVSSPGQTQLLSTTICQLITVFNNALKHKMFHRPIQTNVGSTERIVPKVSAWDWFCPQEISFHLFIALVLASKLASSFISSVSTNLLIAFHNLHCFWECP